MVPKKIRFEDQNLRLSSEERHFRYRFPRKAVTIHSIPIIVEEAQEFCDIFDGQRIGPSDRPSNVFPREDSPRLFKSNELLCYVNKLCFPPHDQQIFNDSAVDVYLNQTIPNLDALDEASVP